MAAEITGNNEAAYIRQQFYKSTENLPIGQRVKARLGFALNRIGQNETVKKWLDKFSKPREIVNPVSRADEIKGNISISESRPTGTLSGRR